MKKILIVFLTLFVHFSFGQKIINDLQGNWICDKIIDSLNVETGGIYANSGEYLKFAFENQVLKIITAPFDNSIPASFIFTKKDSILDLQPDLIYSLPETKFKIKYLLDKKLILQTKSENKKTINYILTNQDFFSQSLKDSSVIDCGAIIIRHYKLDKQNKVELKTAEYIIKMNNTLFYPTPRFDYESSCFGQYLSSNFSFPTGYEIGKTSSELAIEFYVTSKGAENITIAKGIDITIDKMIVNIFDKSKKKWKPVVMDGKTYRIKIRLHLYFYLGLMNT